jgi:hypothetical protein
MTRKADVHYRLVVVSPFGQVLRSGLLLVLSLFSPVPVSMEMGSFCFQQSGTPDSQDPRLTFLYIFLEFFTFENECSRLCQEVRRFPEEKGLAEER